MDSKIETLTQLLESKQEKYPNITTLWKNYINQKHDFFEKSLDNGIQLFTNIDRIQERDMDYGTILSVYLLVMNHAN